MKERSIMVLSNVRKLLQDPINWSSAGQLAEDVGGRPVSPHDPSATKWSFVGALTRYETTILAINAIGSVSGCDLKTLELRATRAELLAYLERAILWLHAWRDWPTP